MEWCGTVSDGLVSVGGCKRSFRECIELFILGYEHTTRENRYTLATLYGVLSNDGHALQELRHSCIWVLSRCSEGARIFPVCEIFFRGWEYNVFFCLEQNRTILSSFTRGSSSFLLPSITSRDAFPTSNPVSSSWYIFLGCQMSLILQSGYWCIYIHKAGRVYGILSIRFNVIASLWETMYHSQGKSKHCWEASFGPALLTLLSCLRCEYVLGLCFSCYVLGQS